MPRPQFRLRSLFILTAIVAVGCWAWHVADMQLADMHDEPEMARQVYAWAVCYYISLAFTLSGVAAFGWLCREKHRLAFVWLSFLPVTIGIVGEVYGSSISYSGNLGFVLDVAVPAVFISMVGTIALLAISGLALIWNFLATERRRPAAVAVLGSKSTTGGSSHPFWAVLRLFGRADPGRGVDEAESADRSWPADVFTTQVTADDAGLAHLGLADRHRARNDDP